MNIFKSLVLAFTMIFCTSASFANDDQSGHGTVAETMASGGYVYVRLQEDNRWVAASPIEVVVGDEVSYSNGMPMKNFLSRTLNRTFEDIVFAVSLEVTKPLNAESHASVHTSLNTEAIQELGIKPAAAAVAPEPGEIAPLEGGKTIGDINTEFQELKGQQTALRARVMKVIKNILGKNWITLQDGTGTAPDNKLLATSADLVEIGDMVTAKGIINTDVDLGSGYKYKVVLEEATFTR